jgi:hypothetical protein
MLLIAVTSAPLLAIHLLAAVLKSQIMLDILLSIVAYSFIWAACGVKRTYESRINLFSKWWWLQLVLICTAVTLARYAYGLSH